MKKAILMAAALAGMGLVGAAAAAPFVYPSKWYVGNPDAVKTGGVYRSSHTGDYSGLNYFFERVSGSIPETTSAGGLFTLDPSTLEYVPYQAETFTVSKDKKVWTLNLRKGMKWSDGKPVTADDYITSFKIFTDPDVESDYYDEYFQDVNGAAKPIVYSKIDNDTIRVTFPTARVDAIDNMAFFRVQPAHIFGPAYEKGPKNVKQIWPLNEDPKNIVSLGAFKLSSFRPGERASFERNPYFGEWNKDDKGRVVPYLDGITEKIYKDRNAEVAGWLAGELDEFLPQNGDDLAQTKKAIDAGQLKASLKANVSPNTTVDRVSFNFNKRGNDFKKALFRNAEFRRAMSHLMNRAAMVDIALGGLGTPAYSPVYPFFKAWIAPNLPKYDYNPEAATGILRKLGFSKKNNDGVLMDSKGRLMEFDLIYNAPNSRRARLSQVITGEMKKAGVKVNLVAVPNAKWGEILGRDDNKPDAPDFDAIMAAVAGGSIIFPFGEFQEKCSGAGHWWNMSGKCLQPWENQVEALYTRGTREYDLGKRQQIGYQIQQVYAQQLPQIFLAGLNYHVAWLDKLENEFKPDMINPIVGNRDVVTTWLK